MSEPFRLLTQGEIGTLRWLAEHGAQRRPVILPARLRLHVPALWRMGLVEVWFRAFPHDQPQALAGYFALSVAGNRRSQPFLRKTGVDALSLSSSRRAPTGARSSSPNNKRSYRCP